MTGAAAVPWRGPCRRVGDTGASAVLAALALLAAPPPGARVVELGCGCGGVLLALARRRPDLALLGVERQPQLAAAARTRLEQAGVAARVAVIHGDVRRPQPQLSPGCCALALANPPFFRPGEGRLPPDPLRAAARFQLAGGVDAFIAAAGRLLAPGGALLLVLSPPLLREGWHALAAAGLCPRQVWPVSHAPGRPRVLVALAARKGGAPGARVVRGRRLFLSRLADG